MLMASDVVAITFRRNFQSPFFPTSYLCFPSPSIPSSPSNPLPTNALFDEISRWIHTKMPERSKARTKAKPKYKGNSHSNANQPRKQQQSLDQYFTPADNNISEDESDEEPDEEPDNPSHGRKSREPWYGDEDFTRGDKYIPVITPSDFEEDSEKELKRSPSSHKKRKRRFAVDCSQDDETSISNDEQLRSTLKRSRIEISWDSDDEKIPPLPWLEPKPSTDEVDAEGEDDELEILSVMPRGSQLPAQDAANTSSKEASDANNTRTPSVPSHTQDMCLTPGLPGQFPQTSPLGSPSLSPQVESQHVVASNGVPLDAVSAPLSFSAETSNLASTASPSSNTLPTNTPPSSPSAWERPVMATLDRLAAELKDVDRM